jgi:hypothetical protein
LHAADPEAVEVAVDLARENRTITAPTMAEFMDALERQRLVRFVARIARLAAQAHRHLIPQKAS